MAGDGGPPTVGDNIRYAEQLFPWLNPALADVFGENVAPLDQAVVRAAMRKFASAWRDGPNLGALLGEIRAECKRFAPSNYDDGRALNETLVEVLRRRSGGASDADLLRAHYRGAWDAVRADPKIEPESRERTRAVIYRFAAEDLVAAGVEKGAADAAARACCDYAAEEAIAAPRVFHSVSEEMEKERDAELRTRRERQRQIAGLVAVEAADRQRDVVQAEGK